MELDKKIVEEATSKAYAILKEAKEERARTLRKEEAKLKVFLKQEKENFKKTLEERKKEEMASARLEAKRIIENAYEKKFREVLDELALEFKKFRKTKKYGKWLNTLLKEALKELEENENSTVVHVSKGDKKLIKTKAKVKEDLEDIGGLILETKDGKVRVNYSFTQLLEMAKENLRVKFMSEMKK